MLSPTLRQTYAVSGVVVNIIGHGCIHGYPAVLIAKYRNEAGTSLSEHEMSWIGSALGLSKIFGIILTPILMSCLGRQKTHLISVIPALIGWAVFFGNSVSMFILARLLHGVAIGLRVGVTAILVAEYADPVYRGAFISTFAVSLALGIFLTHLFAVHLTWRLTAAASAMFPLIALIIISVSPESPSWLIAKGRFDEAKKIFIWLRGHGDTQIEELEGMIAKVKDDSIESTKFTLRGCVANIVEGLREAPKVITNKEFYKPTIVAMSILVTQEFAGVLIVPAYGNMILQSLLNREEVGWELAVVDLIRAVIAVLAIFLVKKFKRRTLLFISGPSIIIFYTSMSIFIYLRRSLIIEAEWILNGLPMVLMSLFIVSFAIGLAPLCWVICGEVFPLKYRSLGSTISGAIICPSAAMSLKTAPYLFATIGVEGAFLVYSVLMAVFLLVLFVMLPETKDRTLLSIENNFKDKTVCDENVEKPLIPSMITNNVNKDA